MACNFITCNSYRRLRFPPILKLQTNRREYSRGQTRQSGNKTNNIQGEAEGDRLVQPKEGWDREGCGKMGTSYIPQLFEV